MPKMVIALTITQITWRPFLCFWFKIISASIEENGQMATQASLATLSL